MSDRRAAGFRQRVRRLAAAVASVSVTSGRAAGAVPADAGLPGALTGWLEAVPRAAWYWVAAGLILAALAGALAGLLMRRGRPVFQRKPIATTTPASSEPAAAARWELSARDAAGSRVNARFGPLDLARAGDGLVLGRNPDLCHFVARNRTVSRRHVRFTIREGELMVEDLNSTSGTLLEGRRLRPMKPVPIHDGDTLVLGDLRLRLSEHA